MTKYSSLTILKAFICFSWLRACCTFTNINLSTQTLDPSMTGFMITGNAVNDNLGISVSKAGDINGDGYVDIIVGASGKNSQQGAVYVIYGGPKSTISNIPLSTQTLDPLTTGFMITGNAAGDYFGNLVSTAGDINGDGCDDIIVGVPGKNSKQGAVYVIYGGPKSTMTNILLSTQTLNPLTTGFMITGNAANDQFGWSVSTAGDINKDGYNDIIIGAYTKSSQQGAAYVVYGGPKSAMTNILLSTQTLNPLNTGFMITGNAGNDRLGSSVSKAGDINGDGYEDIIVGASTKNSYKGAAYVIYGGPKSAMTNILLSTQTLNPLTTGFMITGNAAGDYFGSSVSTAGDINGDGYDDIIVAASGKNNNQGAVYVIYGGPKSTMSNIDLGAQTLDPATTGFMITGNTVGDYFGISARTAGDINGDGCDDIIVGALGNNNNQGEAYVIYGGPKSTMTNILLSTQTLNPLTTGFMITGNAIGDELGRSVNTIGDINGDGYDDIIVGADGKNSYEGAAYVIYACPTCSSCPTNCNTCSSASVCTGCTTPYLLYQAQCVSSCPAGTFVSTNSCQDCSANCNTCGSASSCTGCTPPYLLYQSQCLGSCPTGTFVSTNTCQDCSANCNTCSSASACTGCKSPYLLYQSQCVSSCPAGTFVSTNKCQDCSTNCNTCTSASVCKGCAAPYLLYQSQCVSSCPAGTFVSTNTCQDCPSHCSACTSQTLCQTCDQGYLLSNSLCDLSPSPSPSPPQQTQGQATQAVSSSAKGIGSAICVGRTAPPVAALVSKTVQNTRYLNLSVTAELAEIYQTWDTDMISWDVPTTFSNEDHFKTSPYMFARYGLGSPFLVNFWPTMMNIGISLTLFIICFVLKKLFERTKYKGWIPFMVHKLLAGSFNFAFVQAYACLHDTLFYFVIDIKTNPFNGSFSWASITTALTFLVVGCILVFLNFWTVSRYQRIKKQGLAKRDMKDLKDFNERNKSWEIFYSDFNDDGLLSQSFFAILIIRSTLSSFIIAVLYDYPLVQASILVALDVAILLFLYFKNPFSTLRGKLAQYYYEIITFLVHICTLILSLQDTLKNSSDKLKNVVCTGIIYLNTALIIGTVGFMFIEIYKTIEKARDEKRKQRQNISGDSQEAQNQTRRVSPFQPLESDASNMQARINRDQSVSVENLYFFPGVNPNGNITNYDLNMESSRDLNADTARELYVNPSSSRINQQTNHGTMPIIRPRPLRMNQMQQRSRYIDTSHVDNAGQTDHT